MKYKMGKSKDTLESVQEYFRERDCEPLFTEYCTCKDKLSYKCKCGKETTTTFFSFKRSRGCKSCSSQKYTTKEVIKIFEEQYCTPLFDEYRNTKQQLVYICECGEETRTTLPQFLSGSRCWECGNRKKSFDYDTVENYFKEQGCTLLSTEYNNCVETLKYKCICGKKVKTNFNRFQKVSHCPDCSTKNRSKNTENRLKILLADFNCELLDEYKSGQPFLAKCTECDTEIQLTSKRHLDTWPGCPECKIKQECEAIMNQKIEAILKPTPYIKSFSKWVKTDAGNMYREVKDSTSYIYLEVKLTQDYIMRCDVQELKFLNKHHLCISVLTGKTVYARVGNNLFHNLIVPEYAEVDHINRDGLDNRRSNLRDGTNINPKNKGIPVNNTSGVKGVYYSGGAKARWCAQISVNKKKVKKSFSIAKYGEERAKELAIHQRNVWDEKY